MAVGAGNIWRFPRLIGEFGGTFLIPWLLFLLLWSIPLAIFEYAVGKKTRKGVIGAFSHLFGQQFAWLGAFVAFCTTAILFYYTVVTGWSLWYALKSLSGGLKKADSLVFWETFTTGQMPLLAALVVLLLAYLVMSRQFNKGLEKINKWLLPVLFVLLIGLAVFAITLPGAGMGLAHIFHIDISRLQDARMWLEGLSQSAWSTGAGWGLYLTYGSYMRQEDKVVKNALAAGVGNNLASIFAAVAIVPALFALSPSAESALGLLQQGNHGLTFIVLPRLFDQLPQGGWLISAAFFVALFIAAFSSLLAMFELVLKNLQDLKLDRRKAMRIVIPGVFLFAIPSALYLDFLNNQDWVWGVGLIFSGAIFIAAGIVLAIKQGEGPLWKSFDFVRNKLINTSPDDWQLGKWFNVVWFLVLPIEFLALLLWWVVIDLFAKYDGLEIITEIPNWPVFSAGSLETVVLQLLIVFFLLFSLRQKIYKWFSQ
jgi:NSS family neurotransmitter:Na+ symporter